MYIEFSVNIMIDLCKTVRIQLHQPALEMRDQGLGEYFSKLSFVRQILSENSKNTLLQKLRWAGHVCVFSIATSA